MKAHVDLMIFRSWGYVCTDQNIHFLTHLVSFLTTALGNSVKLEVFIFFGLLEPRL